MINLILNSKNIEVFNNSNIYLVTGLSGSGKSLYCRKIKEKYPDAITIELDWLKHSKYANDFGKILNFEFIKKYPEVVKYMENKFYKIPEYKDQVYKEYINKYFDFIISRLDNKKTYIIDGIQIFSLIDFEKTISKKYNIFIKGTSSFQSLLNRIKRDYDEEEKINFLKKINFFKRVIKESFTFQFLHRKMLNKYIKVLIKQKRMN